MGATTRTIARLSSSLDRIEHSLRVADTVGRHLRAEGCAETYDSMLVLDHEANRGLKAVDKARKRLAKLQEQAGEGAATA